MNTARKTLSTEHGWTIICDDTLSAKEQREDARIASVVCAKVNQMQNHGIPIARYNAEKDEAFLEHSDNIARAHS